MDKKDIEYQKKITRCEKLGAEKFQKFVFKIEDIKFKAIYKFWPNYLKFYDKRCNKKRDKLLRHTKDNETRKRIIQAFSTEKMIAHKEYETGHNRNYHMDMSQPTKIINYLKLNKEIHKKNLKQNAIALPILSVASIITPLAIPLLITEVISTGINMQCINLQNCNLYRLEIEKERLRKIEEKKNKINLNRYGEAAKVIDECLQEKADKIANENTTPVNNQNKESKKLVNEEDIPSVDEIINNIQTKEQAEQMLRLVMSASASRQASASKVAVKSRGGK